MEPILKFDLDEMVSIVRTIEPIQVNIGADSKGHKLPEPSAYEIQVLISELRRFTKVHEKPNLKRLYK